MTDDINTTIADSIVRASDKTPAHFDGEHEEHRINHSVNCYFCADLIDERECLSADDYNNNDGGSICVKCAEDKSPT